MANETTITLVGNVVREVELKFTPSGHAVANFTVASTPRTFDKNTNEWRDGDPLFILCDIWRQPAENVAATLTKGMRVIVTGALRVRQYDRDDGSKGTSVEMTVDEVGPSLRYATATVTRTPSGGGQQQSTQPAGKPSATPAENAAAWGAPAPTQQTGGAAWGQTEAPF